MRAGFTRRQALSAAAAGALVAGLPRLASSQPVSSALKLTDLSANLALIEGAGANVVALGTREGVLVVDGGLAQHAAALFALLAERWPNRPIAVLFNTNWRDEHVGANEVASASGARILAHENTKLWLGGDFYVEWEERHYAPRPAPLWPNSTFYTSGSIHFGGQQVNYLHTPRAHTDGDVAVLFAADNVLVASDLLSVGRYPVLDYSTGGWIGGMLAASRALLEHAGPATRIVPANGPVCGRAELEAQLALCIAMRDKTHLAFRAGMSFSDFVASKPTAEFDARWGDPARFLAQLYKGGFAHLRELGGVI